MPAAPANRETVSSALLTVRGLGKEYPGTVALADVDLDVRPGRVHALLGSNGAGKSTLARIIGGLEAPDAGDVLLDGKSTLGLRPDELAERGLGVVHQELKLFPDLTVEENLAFLGRYPARRGFIARRRRRAQARAALEILGHRDIDPGALVAEISVADAWLVAIAAVLVLEPRVLILDESTAAMTARDASDLFAFLRERAAAGLGVILVSHRLKEIQEAADEITVMRDGRVIETVPADTSKSRLISIMFGREEVAVREAEAERRQDRDARAPARSGEPLLKLEGVAVASAEHVSFEVHPGEVLGIAGAIGSGRSSISQGIAGVLPLSAGSMHLGGAPYRPRSPHHAVRRGVVLLPEDRDANGVLQGMSVRENISASVLDGLGSGPLMNRRSERKLADEAIEEFNIKASAAQEITTLSGGNRQKALLARAHSTGASVLVLDEPTRGLDFDARADLERTISDFAASGKGVIVTSSEFDELARVSTRVIALRNGRTIPFELHAPTSADEGAIAQASYGGEVAA
jgi:ABC-type sugar transport system ATPase subunit